MLKREITYLGGGLQNWLRAGNQFLSTCAFTGLLVLLTACGPATKDNSNIEQEMPVAVDDVVPAHSNESVTINVLANDSLQNKSDISISRVSASSTNNGAVSISSSWIAGDWTDTVTYTPPVNFTGQDNFTYTITNGQNNNTSATVTVNVNNGFGPEGALPKPVIAPGGGTYFSAMQVYIFSIVVDAEVWYSLEGSTNLADMQLLESDYITVDHSMTVTAIAVKDGFDPSEATIANFRYWFQAGTPGSGNGGGGTQAPPFELRVNAGGSVYTDTTGNAWVADQGFNVGQPIATNNAIGATNDPIIYQTARTSVIMDNSIEYSFDVENGGYFVRLHFAEFDDGINSAGERIFDIGIEQNLVADDFDILATSGKNNASVVETYTWVNDGNLNIILESVVGSPVISGIEILANGGFGGPGNIPPIAILLATPSSGAAPLEVELDASNSEDPEGKELTFEWDLDEDGVFGDATGPVVTHVYTEPGIFTPQVKVNDGELSSITFTKVVIPDTTGGGDGTPPPDGPGSPIEITPDVQPADGATGVGIDTSVTATIAGVAGISQIYWAGINLTNGTNFIAGNTKFNSDTFSVEFIPDLPLTPGSTYTATLNASLGFVDGSWSMASFSWTFTTAQ